MEAREGISSGVTVIGAEAPSAYHVAPRSEAPNQVHVPDGGGAAATAAPVGVSPVSAGLNYLSNYSSLILDGNISFLTFQSNSGLVKISFS